MSHKASAWLFELPQSVMSHAEFRLMCHLCDAHNSKRDSDTACFPSQERLREATGMSNGGLNNSLNSLEQRGLIQRRRTTAEGSKIQRTYYILGFDLAKSPEQTPLSGVVTNSTFCRTNSTLEGNKLHSGGVSDEPVSNMEIEPRVTRVTHAREGDFGHKPRARTTTTSGAEKPENAENEKARLAGIASEHHEWLVALAETINSGRYVPPSAVNNTTRDELLAAGLVTRERLRELQVY